MGIEAKHWGWAIGEIKIDVYKIMTRQKNRKIKSPIQEIFMQYNIYSKEVKILLVDDE